MSASIGFDKMSNRKYDPPLETTRLLYDSVRTAKLTEQIADSTTEEMMFQREALQNSVSKIEDMSNVTTAAGVNIKILKEKVIRQKMCLWFLMIALFIANIVVIVTLIKNNGRLYWNDNSSD